MITGERVPTIKAKIKTSGYEMAYVAEDLSECFQKAQEILGLIGLEPEEITIELGGNNGD